jgi:arylsulfatase A-like enzyme
VKKAKQAWGLLKVLSIYTLGWMLLQAWIIFGYSLQGLGQYSFEFSLKALSVPSIVYGLLQFVLGHLVLGAVLVLLLYNMSKHLSRHYQLALRQEVRLGLLLWLFAWITIICANQVFFPYSYFSFMPQDAASLHVLKYVLWAFAGLWSMLSLCYLLLLVRSFIQQRVLRSSVWVLALGLFLVLLTLSQRQADPVQQQLSAAQPPNIIIIGIDAIRPDFLTHNGMPTEWMPHLDAFLQHAANFSHSTTPLARTFAAWTSILTGQYPKHTNARYSLPLYKDLKVNDDLPERLSKAGYNTAFAIDERRFNNIDAQHFHFDQALGPRMGFNDFLLGTINDFPLSNLVVNTWFGRYFFPYNYASRSDFVSYRPQTFNHYVWRNLHYAKHQPLFLGIHFCLPHWSWLWSKAPYLMMPEGNARDQKQYLYALKRADQQFAHFMSGLKQRGLLDHAIVVVMSDHGQSFAEPEFQLLKAAGYQGLMDPQSKVFQHLIEPQVGHGTSVLDVAQTHNVLAFRRYGGKAFVRGDNAQPVSLIDIAPTLLALDHVPNLKRDGISLVPWLYGTGPQEPLPRVFYSETGFTLPGILVSKKSLKKIFQQSANYLMLTDKGRMVVRPRLGKLIIAGKQRAIEQGPWMLVDIPQTTGSARQIIVNKKSGMWSDHLDDDFARKTPAQAMLKQLIAFYGDEITQQG